ncbi:MAG: AAA family ATPase [Rhodocyclaceae bacterium]|nr:AAA family ATPase [Rhodocyclaceae bacterium]
MSDLSVQLRITSIRSRGKFGGVIFAGRTDAGENYVAVCHHKLIPDSSLVDKGQQWRIRGTPSLRETFGSNGFKIKEMQITAVEVELVRPSGRNLIDWIAECPDCQGIGQVRASRLYDHFGPSLVDHIEQKNLGALAEVISEDAAELLCHAFTKHHMSSTLLWLDKAGIPRRIGKKITDFYKDKAQEKIEANPYVLISFEANWKTVDELARQRFSVPLDDPRRLEAAIEESLYRGLKSGHTCLPANQLRTRLTTLLGNSNALADQALAGGMISSQYRVIGDIYQASGMYLIESYLTNRLQAMVIGENEQGQVGLFGKPSYDPRNVDRVIATYERAHAIQLSQEQKEAVRRSAGAYLSLILGGAGTGKTTVLNALYEVLEELQPDVPIYQLALAGRAAQRMSEATGRESMTIAGFLTKVDSGQIDLGSVVVVDEMSMVDVILMYRLLRHIPPGVRLILIGDPSQLPPIGPGLVLHALAGLASIPQTELKVVKRQSSASGIPKVAAAIRAHNVPTWAPYNGNPSHGVSFISCSLEELESTVERVYEELGGTGTDNRVQILSITNSNVGGVKNVNAALHGRYRQGAEPVHCPDAEFGVVGATTLERVPLKVGDLVIYTENDYTLGLRNGSLGRIVGTLPVGEPDEPCCVCDFEGTEYRLTAAHMHALNHAYSITVHKSQGSQFERVIVPIRDSRLLDQTLIYTAVTRGVAQVVIIGDLATAESAIKAPASAARRHITLPTLLVSEIGS